MFVDMTDREKLIKLLNEAHDEYYKSFDPTRDFYGGVADHLLANGVTFAKEMNVPSKWISVEKKRPKVGQWVLVKFAKGQSSPTMFAKNTMAVGRYDLTFRNRYVFIAEGTEVNVSHWMPLPEPPKEEQHGS